MATPILLADKSFCWSPTILKALYATGVFSRADVIAVVGRSISFASDQPDDHDATPLLQHIKIGPHF